MQMATKSAAILVATLALGVVLGMVTQGMLMRERGRRVAEMRAELRTEPGFVTLVSEVIQPRPEQDAAVRTVLEASARRYDSVVAGSRAAVTAVLDSMKAQLAPLLDERQRERLSRMSSVPDPNRRPPRPGEPRRADDRPPRNDQPAGDRPPPPRDGSQPPPPPR